MASKVYKIDEAASTFKDSGGTKAWTLQALADGAGRQSDHIDLGALGTAKAYRFKWEFQCQMQATPTVGNMIDLYLKQSDDAAIWDNDDGTGDIAVSALDKVRNLALFGSVQIDEAAANIPTVLRGVVEIYSRYVSVVAWNGSGAALKNTANVSFLTLTPIPDEVQ